MTLEQLQLTGYDITEKEYLARHKVVTEALKGALDKSRAELRKLFDKLEGVKPEDYFNEAVKFRRLAKLEDELIKAYRAAARVSNTAIEQASLISISNSYYRNAYAVTLGASLSDASFVVPILPKAVIDASVYGTISKWNDKFGKPSDYVAKSGTLLKELLDDNTTKDLIALRREIAQSLALGEGYQKASGRVKKILDTTASNALRIIRTEGHRNMMSGNYALKLAAEDEGIGVRRQIVSVLDDRTRPQSVRVDGKYDNEQGYFIYPGGIAVKLPGNSGVKAWDINDRESVVMSIDGAPPTVRRARNPLTGENEIIDWQPFDEWAKSIGLTKNKYGQLVV